MVRLAALAEFAADESRQSNVERKTHLEKIETIIFATNRCQRYKFEEIVFVQFRTLIPFCV